MYSYRCRYIAYVPKRREQNERAEKKKIRDLQFKEEMRRNIYIYTTDDDIYTYIYTKRA